MAVATIFKPLPDAGVWVQIGSAIVGSAMVQATGSPIEISIGSVPAAGTNGMIIFQDLPPLTLFGGAPGSWTVYAMSLNGCGGVFFSTSA